MDWNAVNESPAQQETIARYGQTAIFPEPTPGLITYTFAQGCECDNPSYNKSKGGEQLNPQGYAIPEKLLYVKLTKLDGTDIRLSAYQLTRETSSLGLSGNVNEIANALNTRVGNRAFTVDATYGECVTKSGVKKRHTWHW